MRSRSAILAVSLVAIVGSVAACSDDESTTISLDEWVAEIEAACQPATEQIAEISPPESLQGVSELSGASEEELSEVSDYLEAIQDVYDPAVDSIDDVGTPDEMADEAEEYLDNARNRQDLLQAAIDAAQAGDGAQVQAELERFGEDDERDAELEEELGLSCDT
jgi:hypothetical protein